MYTADKDRVVALDDIPQSSVGAPLPRIVADERTCLVGFYLEVRDPNWDGTSVRIIEAETTADPVAVVRFPLYCATMFGPPNDEAFDGHPLSSRGLHAYGAFEVHDSSWIYQLERMNSVHPYHRRDRYRELRHFILSFHDSTFECVAPRYEITRHVGPLDRVGEWMHAQLRE
jgi:hypothetical protein